MSSHEGLIVLKKKDHLVTTSFLTRALQQYPTVWGAAASVPENGGFGFEVHRTDSPISLDQLEKIQKEYEKMPVLMYFGNWPANAEEDWLQPYMLVKDRIVVCMTGDFHAYEQAQAAAPTPYFVFTKNLAPKFGKLAKGYDNDMDKLWDEFDDEVTQQDMLNLITGSGNAGAGTLAMLSVDGRSTNITRGEFFGEFPWGFSSHKLESKEDSHPAAKKSRFAGILGMKPEGPVSSVPKIAGIKQTAPEKVVPSTPVTSPLDRIAATEKGNVVTESGIKDKLKSTTAIGPTTYACPKHLNNKGKKRWYEAKLGYCPQHWAELPAITVYPDGKTVLETSKTIKSLNDPKLQQAMEPKKEALPINKPPPAEVIEPNPDITPIMDPAEKKDLIENTLTMIVLQDSDLHTIPDPEKLRAAEAKWPTYTEMTGTKDLMHTARWPFAFRHFVANKHPQAMAALLGEWVIRCIIAETRLATALKSVPEPQQVVERQRKFAGIKS